MTNNWSPLVQEAIESRPCPKCGAAALCCSESVAVKRKKGRRPADGRTANKPK
jgi:hypothetical protein